MDQETLDTARDYLRTFTTDSGARVLEDIEASYGARLSYTRGDPNHTVFREGQRNVLLTIRKLMDMAEHPDKYETPKVETPLQPMDTPEEPGPESDSSFSD
ncbi:hypothetical protein CMI37_31385 [Candidatus Pacearchaeota archaeon]|nr:hypothetical protein [Candidatus Pacearchaeota archaeon]|tara:strand:+ start:5034 stop:5336 length:303 start_codon:yes stop_codon:yes gene_type:complete